MFCLFQLTVDIPNHLMDPDGSFTNIHNIHNCGAPACTNDCLSCSCSLFRRAAPRDQNVLRFQVLGDVSKNTCQHEIVGVSWDSMKKRICVSMYIRVYKIYIYIYI